MRIAQEEIFGPVLTAIEFSDEAEALEIANGVEYGLAGYVWTGDTGRSIRMARDLDRHPQRQSPGFYRPVQSAPVSGCLHPVS